ncbi:MAG: hypothetical protein ACOYIP_03615 [Coriobacteriales bacterium]|jgi:hypothetical protein
MSISFDEALEIALGYCPDYNYCVEKEPAFIFSVKDLFAFGGIGSPIAVLKKDGSVVPFPAYISMYKDTEPLREGPIETPEDNQQGG